MLIRRTAAAVSAASLAIAGASMGWHPAAAADPRPAAINAAGWLSGRQASDGSLPGPGARVDEVAEAAAAVAATGTQGDAVRQAMQLVASRGPAQATRGGQAGRLVAGIRASGQDARRLGGHDFVAHLQTFYDKATGRYDSQVFAHTLAVLGVAAAGEAVPEGAVRYLGVNQCRDGGFGHEPGCIQGADTDTTALVVAALIATGSKPGDSAVARARSWLLAARNAEGGFGDRAGAPTNANSTGLALSAIAALGERPDAAPWPSGNSNAVDALLRLQSPEGGFRYRAGGQPDGYATVQAIPGLLGLAHPLPAPAAPAGTQPKRSGDGAPAAGTAAASPSTGDTGAPPGAESGAPTSSTVDSASADAGDGGSNDGGDDRDPGGQAASSSRSGPGGGSGGPKVLAGLALALLLAVSSAALGVRRVAVGNGTALRSPQV